MNKFGPCCCCCHCFDDDCDSNGNATQYTQVTWLFLSFVVRWQGGGLLVCACVALFLQMFPRIENPNWSVIAIAMK